ncbi:FAR1-related sequence 10 [Prunus dulcis]|uniref:FAR1-related sequence 10 n=1 Tax=Prunus dulcis TaxID=3755 RepID=A0A5H2Y1T4_PRUDU|nr:FAR1-related sequence 10 [Prunus dulcis]
MNEVQSPTSETSSGDKQELPLSNFQKPNLLLQKKKNEDTQLWRTLLKKKEQGLKPTTQFFHWLTQLFLKCLIQMLSKVSIICVSKMVGDSEENDDCVIADEMIYIPEVRNEKRPKVGMKFDSLDFVYDFYNRYALLAGFSIVIPAGGKNTVKKF